MNEAKVRLSTKEMELLTNADWILTKNGLMQKTRSLLEDLQALQQEFLSAGSQLIPPVAIAVSPKISKGENYGGLPYLILDHPRYFDKENVFAIRTMFWWGNFFSATLHLSGSFKNDFSAAIISHYPFLATNDFYACVHDEEWEHHFENNNYKPVSEMKAGEFEKLVRDKSFIKLAQKIPLEKWEDARELLLKSFRELITLLRD
jgi:hypothetical protein